MDSDKIYQKRQELEQYFLQSASQDLCLAFSGGVDSSLLLKIAVDALGKRNGKVYAVTFDSRLHPSCDLEIAKRVAGELGGIHEVITVNELEQEEIRSNPVNRCYLCKRHLFRSLKKFAADRKIPMIVEGTNEDDRQEYRPGIQALKELGIVSPLAELHITKKQVKEMAAVCGISVASRPSTPCMATRIPYGQNLDYEILAKLAEGEAYLRTRISGNVRLRLHRDVIRMEVDESRIWEVIKRRREILEHLERSGFSYVTLDLKGFRSGSMDIYVREESLAKGGSFVVDERTAKESDFRQEDGNRIKEEQ